MIKVCIIGMGNMGTAISEQLRSKKLFIVDECKKASNANESIANADAFILAIKPQDFKRFTQMIKTDLGGKLAISIMAGVSVGQLEMGLRTRKVVRVMPNLALKAGKAFSGWFAGSGVGTKERNFIKQLLGALGEEIEVDREEKINAITAISGSGPAYFYFVAEILGEAAMKYGFSRDEAMKIVVSTLVGSAELLAQGSEGIKELKEKVTSKGGTTEAALNYMKLHGFQEIFVQAIEEARIRAEELNQ